MSYPVDPSQDFHWSGMVYEAATAIAVEDRTIMALEMYVLLGVSRCTVRGRNIKAYFLALWLCLRYDSL